MKNFLLVFAILALILLAGTYDYTEQVCYNMPKATYKMMKAHGWSDHKIATEYVHDAKKWNEAGEKYAIEHAECMD